MAGRPKSERPFRIFDERTRMDVPHRAYVTLDRAVDKALTILYRLDIGDSYTVYDSERYVGIVQFTRHVNDIQILTEGRGEKYGHSPIKGNGK